MSSTRIFNISVNMSINPEHSPDTYIDIQFHRQTTSGTQNTAGGPPSPLRDLLRKDGGGPARVSEVPQGSRQKRSPNSGGTLTRNTCAIRVFFMADAVVDTLFWIHVFPLESRQRKLHNKDGMKEQAGEEKRERRPPSSVRSLAHLYFPASGQAVVTGVVPSFPRFSPSFFIARRVQQSHCSSTYHQVLLTHAVALSASQFVHKKKFPRFYSSVHSGGLELTKLTYTRLEDNLIRHRGNR